MQEPKRDAPTGFPMLQPPFMSLHTAPHHAQHCPFTASSSFSLSELRTSMVSGKPAAAAGVQQPEEPDHACLLEVWGGHGSARRRHRLLHPLLQHRGSRPELHH